MKWVQRIIWSLLGVMGVVVLCAVGAALFLATAGEESHRWMVKTLIESALDRTAHVDGEASLDLGLHSTLIATDLWVENPSWAENREMVRVKRIEVQFGLRPLFSGIVLVPRLKVDGLRVEIEKNIDGKTNWTTAGANSGLSRGDSINFDFVPLLEFIYLNDVTLTFRDRAQNQKTEIFLDELVQRRQADNESLTIQGKGQVDKNDFSISGTFGSIHAALSATKPFPIHVSLDAPGLSARLSGTVADLGRGTGLKVDLSATTPSIQRLFKIWGVAPPLEGEAKLTANFNGDLEHLAVNDLRTNIIGPSGNRISATGTIADISMGKGLDIRIAGRLGAQNNLWRQLPGELGAMESVDFSGRIAGNLDTPSLEDFKLRSVHRTGAELSATGRLALDLSSGAPKLAAINASAEAAAPNADLLKDLLHRDAASLGPVTAHLTLSLAKNRILVEKFGLRATAFGGLRLDAKGSLGILPAIGSIDRLEAELDVRLYMDDSAPLLNLSDKSLQSPGPLSATGRLAGKAGQLRLDKIRLRMGTKKSFWAQVTGQVGKLRPGAEKTLDNISLAVRFGWPTSSRLKRVLDLDFPELGKATGQLTLTGSSNQLHVPMARLETKRNDGLTANAKGRIRVLSLSPQVRTTKLEFDLTARSNTTAAVAKFFDQEMMELGPVRAHAKLRDHRGRYLMSDIKITAGPRQAPLITIGGQVEDLAQLTGIDLAGRFDIAASRLLKPAPGTDPTILGTLSGNFTLSDADGSLGIEDLNIAAQKTTLFDMRATGTLDDLRQFDEIKLNTTFASPDFSKLSRTLGLDAKNIGSVQFKGLVSGGGKRFGLEGDLRVGRTVVTAQLTGAVAGNRPTIKGLIHSPLLRLADFGIMAQPETTSTNGKAARKSEPDYWIFPNSPLSMEGLKELDLDIEFGFDEYEGPAVIVDKIDGRLVLKAGVLTLDPVHFRFFKGTAEMTGRVDTQNDPPAFRMTLTADDVDLGKALQKVGRDVPLAAEVDVILDLKTTGNTPRAMASSLDGKMDFAIQRGKIRSGLFSLTALDTIGWLFPVPGERRYSDLNCFIGRFSAQNGMIRTKVLLLDTPDVQVSGQGIIDLRTEEIRIGATPIPKGTRLIRLTTPFFIEGKLASPSINVSKSGAVAHMAGNILLSPVKRLGALLPFISDRGKDSDNPCLAATR